MTFYLIPITYCLLPTTYLKPNTRYVNKRFQGISVTNKNRSKD